MSLLICDQSRRANINFITLFTAEMEKISAQLNTNNWGRNGLNQNQSNVKHVIVYLRYGDLSRTDGKVVAVKRLLFNTRQWVDEFFNEVNLISGIQHKNPVKLLGCRQHRRPRKPAGLRICHQQEPRALHFRY